MPGSAKNTLSSIKQTSEVAREASMSIEVLPSAHRAIHIEVSNLALNFSKDDIALLLSIAERQTAMLAEGESGQKEKVEILAQIEERRVQEELPPPSTSIRLSAWKMHLIELMLMEVVVWIRKN